MPLSTRVPALAWLMKSKAPPPKKRSMPMPAFDWRKRLRAGEVAVGLEKVEETSAVQGAGGGPFALEGVVEFALKIAGDLAGAADDAPVEADGTAGFGFVVLLEGAAELVADGFVVRADDDERVTSAFARRFSLGFSAKGRARTRARAARTARLRIMATCAGQLHPLAGRWRRDRGRRIGWRDGD